MLDKLFTGLNFFDTATFFFLLVPIVWMGWGWKSGVRLTAVLFVSSIVNYSLKEMFQHPRPFHLEEMLGVIQVRGYGFPSGAAQTVVLLTGILYGYWKHHNRWVLGSTYILLISFSRVYLGVHFPTDILAGWAVGMALLAVYRWGFPWIEEKLSKLSFFTLFGILFLCAIAWLWVDHSSISLQLSGAMLGVSFGLAMSQVLDLFLPPARSVREQVIRCAVGVSGVFGLYLLSMAFLPVQIPAVLFGAPFLSALWLSLGSHLVCRRVRIKI
ncbi:MAG: hypothetical protein S4CHLAM102_09670 [Chlamydiia bacterium]|nr:hypothetical protein [Chlamydiia bacterium]